VLVFFGCSRNVLKAATDGSALFYFGQQFLLLLSDDIGYLGQNGLAMIYGSLHIVQLPLKFCTLDFQLGQLWIGPEGRILQSIDRLRQLFNFWPVGVPSGQQGFTIGQVPLDRFCLQGLIFENGQIRQDLGESWRWITLNGQEDFLY